MMEDNKEEREKVIRDTIKEVVSKHSDKLSPHDIKMHEKLLEKIHIEGKRPFEAMDIPKEFIEWFYSNAFNLYNSAKYEEARKIFYILNVFDPQDSRFWYGLAACHHMEKQYDVAIFGYTKCLFIPPVNPMTYFHLADCYEKLGFKREAAVMLQTCIRHATTDPQYAAMQTRAKKELEQLLQQIDKEAEEEDRKEATAESKKE
jgi:type III secretion system low calcium response chaperone LcrH/SycD